MRKQWFRLSLGACAVAVALAAPMTAEAKKQEIPAPIYPVKVLLEDKKVEIYYPSVAGDFLVYSRRKSNEYSVVRVPVDQATAAGREITPDQPHEAIRFGVALKDGSIGYISNRMGPISAWMRQGAGDGHVAIGNISTFTGALMPANLKSSLDGKVWCFDTSLENKRRSRILDDFGDGYSRVELLAQSWRMYSSDSWRYKQGYAATKTGAINKFPAPALFLFDRMSSQLTMIPNAFNGAISPDGKRVVFVRENNGNYDLWMQNVDGSNLTQLTSTEYGEFEPAFSPDGKRIAFVSNRDSEGEVLYTSLYVMDLKTAAVTRVTNAPFATDGGVTWKDNHTLIFHSNRTVEKPQAKTSEHWALWQVEMK